MQKSNSLMEKIISLCKRRGFIFPSSEIYGGLGSAYDYGPLGVELKNNLKKVWWKKMVQEREDIVGLDSSILMSAKVWQASGHLENFTDPLVECKSCHKRFKFDEIEDEKKCPECGGELTPMKKFNLMMKTYLGPVEDAKAISYLRPETCQGIYVDFETILNASRKKIPFGVAQIGKAFRNEITPKNFTYRTREFEQMEMQYFIHPKEAKKWFDYWKEQRMRWYLDFGIKKQNLKFYEHKKDELSHYAKAGVDVIYNFPFGENEIEGIHNRGDWDLSQHSKYSGKDLKYKDEEHKEPFYPYIIETSGGIDRSALAFLIDAYTEVEGGRTTTTKSTKEVEIVLKLHKDLVPYKVAVLPLSKKPELVKVAKEVHDNLRPHFMTDYDEVSSIGRRYRRQDEIGTLYCITVDFESLEDKKVTVRDRDTMKQDRIVIGELVEYLQKKLE